MIKLIRKIISYVRVRNNLHNEYLSLLADNNQLKEENITLKGDIENMVSNINKKELSYTIKYDEFKKRISNIEAKVSELRDSLKHKEEELLTKSKEIERISLHISSLEKRVKERDHAYGLLRAKNEKLEEEMTKREELIRLTAENEIFRFIYSFNDQVKRKE